MGKLIQFLSAWAFVMPLVASGQVLEARGDSVGPGGLGRLWLEWSGLSEGPAWLEVEAPEELVFLELPSIGESRRGEALIFFMVHPFARAGNKELVLQIRSGERVCGRVVASVLIHERAGAEFAVLEERRDSTIASVSNTGNISLDVEGEEIAPGEVLRLRMAREEESNWVLKASGGSWDTTVVLPLRKRFYPHQTEGAIHNTGSDVLSASLSGQWSGGQWNHMVLGRFAWENWSGNLAQWNGLTRGVLSYESGRGKGVIGYRNARALEIIRPGQSAYFRGQIGRQPLSLFLDNRSAVATKNWSYKAWEAGAGMAWFEGRLVPTAHLDFEGHNTSLRWQQWGGLRDVQAGWQGTKFGSHARRLQVSEFWREEVVMGELATIGTSYRTPKLRWNHQSVLQGDRDFHSALLQYSSGAWQWACRGQFQSHAQRFGSGVRGQYRWGNHQFSGRAQWLSTGEKTSGPRWNAAYNWRGRSSILGVSSQELVGENWAHFIQIGYQNPRLSLSAQTAYRGDLAQPWFPQLHLIQTRPSGQWALSSNPHMPLRLQWSGTLVRSSATKTLKGQILDHQGLPLPEIELFCQGKPVHTDDLGRFAFHHLTGETATVHIVPTSLPFATFPIDSYTREIPLSKRNAVLTINCYKSCGIHGTVLIQYDSAKAFRPRPNPALRAILTHSDGTTYTTQLSSNYTFKISGLREGVYTARLDNTGDLFQSLPVELYIEEGTLVPLELLLIERSRHMPIQRL
jgi:hypothetical protein